MCTKYFACLLNYLYKFKIYCTHTGQDLKTIEDALERDTFMTAEEAKNFGLIDTVVDKREAVKEESE